MKKKLLVLTLLFSMSSFLFAQRPVGSWSIQPKVGLNLSTMTNDNEAKIRPALAAGLEIDYMATSRFALSFGALYSQQGCKGNFEGYNGVIKLDYINVPILANFYVVNGLALKVGIQPGFLINDKIKVSANGASAEVGIEQSMRAAGLDVTLNNIDLAIPIGASYEFKNFQIEARYNWGLMKILKGSGVDTTKNSVFQFTIGYRFNLSK